MNAHTSHAKGREKLLAHLAMLTFSMLVAGSFSFGGIAARTLPAEPLTLLRYLLTVVVLGGLTFGVLRVPFRLPRQFWRFVILGGLIALYMVTMFHALGFTSPVSTGAVFTLMPLISAGFALPVLGQKTRPDVLAGLVIAAFGALWVIFRGSLDALFAFGVGRGELIYLVGVIAHALYVPLIRRFARNEHPLAFGFWVTVATVFWLLVPGAGPLAATALTELPPSFWLAVLYLAVVTTAITFILLQFASMRLPAAKVLGYNYLTPGFIILIEGVLGHGWASPTVAAGALITAGGLVLIALLPD
ncbi:DMT family transporter [Ensifer soli]|uniref:DMT family transporter n=1 Tax=Ciceribacter sp. sgz301302 TaxID=3342379 RepID=UPI0035B87E74